MGQVYIGRSWYANELNQRIKSLSVTSENGGSENS